MIAKQQKKNKLSDADRKTLNFYLNKELPSRRNWIRATNANERIDEIINKYPVFKDHVEVILLIIF